MIDSKKNIGQLFSQKRKEMSLSLKEVENATSIRMLYLQAIEEGTVDKFLSPVYALGFIKQYATFLGLDGDSIIKEHPIKFNPKVKKQEFDYGIGTLEVRNAQLGSGKWSLNFLWIGVSIAVILIAWFLAKALGIF